MKYQEATENLEDVYKRQGWDCPRAKILVKLREGGSEEFQIQTIGRIRRMPERKHYGINVLDFCYLYTLDTKYKAVSYTHLDVYKRQSIWCGRIHL